MGRYPELESSIVSAVEGGTRGRRVAVAFSGGMDSGLASALSSRFAESVTLYTCGSDGSFDVRAAEELSERLSLPWVHLRISEDNVEGMVHRLIAATGTSDPFTISYELQLFCVCESCREDVVVTGQGADEYFMGCAKYVDCPEPRYSELVRAGVERLVEVSVPCELSIAEHFGRTLVYPYMDPDVVECVGRIDPEELRPRDMDDRKSVLKRVCEDLGYPFLANRTKKSSQYGSGTTDIIHALARRNGMYFNQYIAHLYREVTGSDGDCPMDHTEDRRPSSRRRFGVYGEAP